MKLPVSRKETHLYITTNSRRHSLTVLNECAPSLKKLHSSQIIDWLESFHHFTRVKVVGGMVGLFWNNCRPISLILVINPVFFAVFFEKSCPCVWSVRKKSLPLHSLSGSNRGGILGCIFLLASRRAKMDLWQTANKKKEEDKQRVPHYI